MDLNKHSLRQMPFFIGNEIRIEVLNSAGGAGASRGVGQRRRLDSCGTMGRVKPRQWRVVGLKGLCRPRSLGGVARRPDCCDVQEYLFPVVKAAGRFA